MAGKYIPPTAGFYSAWAKRPSAELLAGRGRRARLEVPEVVGRRAAAGRHYGCGLDDAGVARFRDHWRSRLSCSSMVLESGTMRAVFQLTSL